MKKLTAFLLCAIVIPFIFGSCAEPGGNDYGIDGMYLGVDIDSSGMGYEFDGNKFITHQTDSGGEMKTVCTYKMMEFGELESGADDYQDYAERGYKALIATYKEVTYDGNDEDTQKSVDNMNKKIRSGDMSESIFPIMLAERGIFVATRFFAEEEYYTSLKLVDTISSYGKMRDGMYYASNMESCGSYAFYAIEFSGDTAKIIFLDGMVATCGYRIEGGKLYITPTTLEYSGNDTDILASVEYANGRIAQGEDSGFSYSGYVMNNEKGFNVGYNLFVKVK